MKLPTAIWVAMLQVPAADMPPPYFTALSVAPASTRETGAFHTGMVVSIYGRNLGPARGCTAEPPREPTELCGTEVTVDGEKAPLLYVQERQINVRLPAGDSNRQELRFVVNYSGRRSEPVAVPSRRPSTAAGREVEVARISLIGRAYVRMPIWLRVDLPGLKQRTVRYPVTIYPGDFGGHDFEVRYRGKALSKIKAPATMPRAGGGLMALGSIGGGGLIGLPHEPRQVGRLPLHLAFHFEDPGEYQVRYTGYDVTGEALVRSAWLSLRIEPYSERERMAWLKELQRTSPQDSVDLVSEYLPSLLAHPDSDTLRMLEPALYHSADVVRQYAQYALFLFDDQDIVEWMPDVLTRRGPTPELAYFLSWRQALFEPQANRLLSDIGQHLGSHSPLVAGGALQALAFMKQYTPLKNNAAKHAEMDALVTRRADSMLRSNSHDVLQSLALYLGTVKTDRSRLLLWRLVDQGTVREQALICLTWIADRRDLPRLATYAEKYRLDYSLRRAYGASAEPFLTPTRSR